MSQEVLDDVWVIILRCVFRMANNVLLNDSDNRGLDGHRSLLWSPAEELLDFIDDFPEFAWSESPWRVVAWFSDMVVLDDFRHRLESLCHLGGL